MRVLYANQVFLDYRVPYYKRLIELFGGEYYVMYSPNRYYLMHRDDLVQRIEREFGKNAIAFKHDYLFDTATMSFSRVDGERGQKIPFMFGFLTAIRRVKPDVLITEAFFQWTPWAVLYHCLFGTPLFIGYERTLHTERNNARWKTWHRRLTDKFVKGYLVNGQETKKYLLSIGIKEDKIHCVGISADSEGLKKSVAAFRESSDFEAFRQKYHHPDGLMYLFTGQIVERKGVKYLLAAWLVHQKKFPNDTLVICGGGDQFEALNRQYGHESGVFMEGRVDYNEIYRYYAVADVFVLPTLEDNWSLVIPEAMACGLPVATSIYNGCHVELIHEGENGCVFDTLDESSLLKALAYFHDKDLVKMGQRSVELEKYFDTEHCTQRVYEVLKKESQ